MSTVFQPLQRGNTRQIVVSRILSAVIRQQFPAGHRLVVQQLAEQFDVSATPVREALVELMAIGVVEMIPNRGAILKPFGIQQVREIYQLRRILEVEATRCACGRIDLPLLTALEQELLCNDATIQGIAWAERMMELDIRLHELIASHCGNDRLEYEINRYNTIMQVIREIVDNERNALEIAAVEHLEIVRALIEEQPEKAAQAMARHIESTSEIVQQAMFPEDSH